MRFADQARFHPRKYLAGLARAIRAKGGEIFEHSPADEFLADPLRVEANGRRLRCKDVVIATHNPIAGVVSTTREDLFQTKLALYTSYVVAGRVTRDTVPDALFWDTASPYHYLRTEPHRDHQLVIFGGEDHKTGQVSDTSKRYAHLEAGAPGSAPGDRHQSSMVGASDRDARRTALHRQDGGPSVRGNRLRWKRHDLRHACRDHDRGRDPGPTEPVGRSVRSCIERRFGAASGTTSRRTWIIRTTRRAVPSKGRVARFAQSSEAREPSLTTMAQRSPPTVATTAHRCCILRSARTRAAPSHGTTPSARGIARVMARASRPRGKSSRVRRSRLSRRSRSVGLDEQRYASMRGRPWPAVWSGASEWIGYR